MVYAHASLNDNPRRTHDFEPLQVDGRIPDGLRGTLVRTGPGVPERFGRRVRHAFEADGLMTAVRFGDGGVTGGVQPVRGPGWLAEEAAGRPLYSTAASWADRARAVLQGRGKATGNTSMWAWNGALYALMEGSLPVRIDPATLATLGTDTLGDVVPGAFSAHPRRVASLATTFNFGCRFGRTMEIDLFALPDGGPARQITTVEVPFNAMVHDFVATDTHLVLLVCPAKLRSLRAMLGLGSFDTWFDWRPADGTLAIVVPLADPDAVERFTLDPFFFFHTANAWSDGDTVVIDLAWYPDLSSLAEIGTTTEAAARPTLHRCRLDVRTGGWSSAPVAPLPFEFPHVHPTVAGARHGGVFGITESATRGHRGIARLADGAATTWLPGAAEQASEPVLVPRSAGEDDVWVLTLVHDDATDRSYVAVLDGQHLGDGPIARVWFDQTIPLTFHGTWLSA